MPSKRPPLILLLLAGLAAADDHSDDPYQGTWLTPGSSISGSIDPAGERDWFRLTVSDQVSYRFETSQLTLGMDSVIALFAPDGQRVGYDDDGGVGLASRIDWTATASGTAYLVVLHYASTQTGGYQLETTASGPVAPPPPPPPPPAGAVPALPQPPDPMLVGPYGVGRLNDLNYRNVVAAQSVFPMVPEAVLARDGASSSSTLRNGQDLIRGYDVSGSLRYPATTSGLNTPVAAGGPFPLVVIAHGNHRRYSGGSDPSAENYRGYLYLQDHLASHGFVSLSVDLDDFTDLAPGIVSRGWLLLYSIEAMEILSGNSGFQLYGQIDLDRIALLGHSRGGEAVVQAQRLDQMLGGSDGGPAVGPGSGEGRFGIDAVVAVAATRFFDGSFDWGGSQTVPESVLASAVPFLGVWGDADGDVDGSSYGSNTTLHVQAIYDGSPAAPKQFVFVHGANHNAWNTSWASDDGAGLVSQRISASAQRSILVAYATSFLLGHLAGQPDYLDYFRFSADKLLPISAAASSVQLQYQAASPQVLHVDDFESQSSLGTTSEGASPVGSSSLVSPVETWLTGADRSSSATRSWFHRTRALLTGWNASSDVYQSRLTASQEDVRGYPYLSFRIGQDARHSSSGSELVIEVGLEDAGGVVAWVSSQQAGYIPVAQRRYDDVLLSKSMLKTLRLPLAGFSAANPSIDLSRVRRVHFKFSGRPQGQVAIDDIEFSP